MISGTWYFRKRDFKVPKQCVFVLIAYFPVYRIYGGFIWAYWGPIVFSASLYPADKIIENLKLFLGASLNDFHHFFVIFGHFDKISRFSPLFQNFHPHLRGLNLEMYCKLRSHKLRHYCISAYLMNINFVIFYHGSLAPSLFVVPHYFCFHILSSGAVAPSFIKGNL